MAKKLTIYHGTDLWAAIHNALDKASEPGVLDAEDALEIETFLEAMQEIESNN